MIQDHIYSGVPVNTPAIYCKTWGNWGNKRMLMIFVDTSGSGTNFVPAFSISEKWVDKYCKDITNEMGEKVLFPLYK